MYFNSFGMQVLLYCLFGLIFVLIYSESGSLRYFFSATCLSLISSLWMIFQIQIPQYNWIGIWYAKTEIWLDVKDIEVSPNLNPSVSTITTIKIKNYFKWSMFEPGTKFTFFILICSYVVGQYEQKTLLCWPFTRHIWKAIFFAPAKNHHGT